MKNFSRTAASKKCVQMMMMSLLIWTIAACSSQSNEYVEPPPPKVTIAQTLQKEVIDYLEFTGTTRARISTSSNARVVPVNSR